MTPAPHPAALDPAQVTGPYLDVLLVAVAALWGALAGSALPRAVHRFAVPAGEPWRSACPAGHPLPRLLGRARCGVCPADSARYGPAAPALSLATALACAALALATGTRPELAVWLLLTPGAVLLTVVDLRVRRLPDVLTLPLAAAALALLGLAALAPEHAGHWPTALYGALALGAGYLLLFIVNPDGMGFGDVKLALGAGAVLGWYGWGTLLLGTFAGFACGALYGGALVVLGRAGRRTAIPFGPFMLAGVLLGVLAGAYSA
ncbi:prepilin peptidase [Streptomyces sp. XM83C]|jgi:leader peptidase (prepilin peptidase)/N-methyltransferase|uniref:Prepilin peptidase n=1 Tax=Streptomyces thermocoprophilus TaxID=78356 RepID=A0ABV5VF84_9ACTN|nr:prepilin peptidase [Streptomyces sp. XM83C]MCK1818321.1 prepilin peptidase [Streptomyces sp. XM83C]